MKKLYSVFIVESLTANTITLSSLGLIRIALVFDLLTIDRLKSENKYLNEKELTFHQNRENTSKEPSITLSLVEYSRLRERI